MAKLSSTSRRPFGRRLRSVAVAGLIVGATGAFFPGGHAAHAASRSYAPPGGNNSCFPPITSLNTKDPIPQGPDTSGFVTELIPLGAAGTLSVRINGDGTVQGVNDNSLSQCPGETPTGTSYQATTFGGDGIVFKSINGRFQTCTLTDSFTDPSVPIASNQLTIANNGSTVTDTLDGQLKCTDNVTRTFSALIVVAGSNTTTTTTPTPELGSGELLATGLVPALGIVLYRRRRQRRASK
jgi:hypothetical protein